MSSTTSHLVYVGEPTPQLRERARRAPPQDPKLPRSWGFTITVDPNRTVSLNRNTWKPAVKWGPLKQYSVKYKNLTTFDQYVYLRNCIYNVVKEYGERMMNIFGESYASFHYEKTTHGQLHAHGVFSDVILVDTEVEWIQKMLDWRVGRTLIERIDEGSKWYEYQSKQREEMLDKYGIRPTMWKIPDDLDDEETWQYIGMYDRNVISEVDPKPSAMITVSSRMEFRNKYRQSKFVFEEYTSGPGTLVVQSPAVREDSGNKIHIGKIIVEF